MTEAATRHHGLGGFVGFQSGANPEVTLAIRSDLASINLRGDADNAAFVAAAEKALEQSLPTTANTMSSGVRDIYWLGPDEWQVFASQAEIDSIAAALAEALDGIHAAVNVINGGQIALTLTGDKARELMSKGCTIDFHPSVFRDGMCVQSGLAKASVLIGKYGKGEQFLIIVRRSFSDYLVRWLKDAGTEYGIRIEES